MNVPTLKHGLKQKIPIKVLFVGKNGLELDSIYAKLLKYSQAEFIAEKAENLKDAALKALSLKPSCIIIDDNLNNEEINELTQSIDQSEDMVNTPISILKSSNERQVVNSRIQDFIWKEGITPDSLARSVYNALRFSQTNILYRTLKKGKRTVQSVFK